MVTIEAWGYGLAVTENGLTKVYLFSAIEMIDYYIDSLNNYYVRIKFLARKDCVQDDLILKLSALSVNNIVFTNDLVGANLALTSIQNLISSTTNASIDALNANVDQVVTGVNQVVDGIDELIAGQSRTPYIARITTATTTVLNFKTYSVSVSNIGTGTLTVNGVTVKQGETVNFTAGAVNNFYAPGAFTLVTGAPADVLVIANTI